MNYLQTIPTDIHHLVYNNLDKDTYNKMVCVDKATQSGIRSLTDPVKLANNHIPKRNDPRLDEIVAKHQKIALEIFKSLQSIEKKYQKIAKSISDLKKNLWTRFKFSICMSNTFCGRLAKKIINIISGTKPIEEMISKHKNCEMQRQEFVHSLKQISQNYLDEILEKYGTMLVSADIYECDIKAVYFKELLARKDIAVRKKVNAIKRVSLCRNSSPDYLVKRKLVIEDEPGPRILLRSRTVLILDDDVYDELFEDPAVLPNRFR